MKTSALRLLRSRRRNSERITQKTGWRSPAGFLVKGRMDMKKIAVITGASSGMGRRFAETVQEFGTYDEIWAIARRADRLEELKNHTAFPVRTISLDLSYPASYETYAALLREEQPEVGLLINASGFGKFRAVMDTPLEVNLNMVDLNCKAVMALCQLTVPYMPSGSQIINIASVAAFQPIPFINVYGATKALVLHYSRALNRELKKQGVHVMAVCPFWTKTEFFDRAVASDEKPVVKKYIAMYKPEEIVAQAWKDAKKGKDMSKCGFKARLQALGVKILPHSMVMDTWLRQQELD